MKGIFDTEEVWKNRKDSETGIAATAGAICILTFLLWCFLWLCLADMSIPLKITVILCTVVFLAGYFS